MRLFDLAVATKLAGGGGGGGSSDFTTATVTFNINVEMTNLTLFNIIKDVRTEFDHTDIPNPLMVIGEYVPIESGTASIVLNQGTAYAMIFDLENTLTVSGDASVSSFTSYGDPAQLITITGDCTITVS